ncbi:UDP-glucose dehydrogenase family protein [Streptosporangium sp. CA-115845]|uniref:UDP-glucose dehydrogenase family protein n=1 Tax=Streptosporangium sp. CA-115845 TaxID=3240071 RepID=UPI003D8C2455
MTAVPERGLPQLGRTVSGVIPSIVFDDLLEMFQAARPEIGLFAAAGQLAGFALGVRDQHVGDDESRSPQTQGVTAVRKITSRRVWRVVDAESKLDRPVGTTRRLAELARSMAPAHVRVTVACSPDFLRESTSLADVARPSRIVLGIASGDEHAEQLLRRVWKAQLDAGALMVVTDLTTAEMCKTAANAFLATKISFINAVASLCEATGTDVSSLAHTLALDPRIGDAYLNAGIGYGGSCLPKDVRSLIAQGRTHGAGADLELLVQVDRVNQRRRLHTVDLARHACGGDLTNRRVGVWGLSFKPDVDDLRDSPALAVALAIHHEGGIVTAYDPAAMDFARDLHPELRYALAADGAVEGAEVLLHLTAWPEFIEADPAKLVRSAAVPIVVDGRATLDPDLWSDAGWSYRALGRG